MQTAIFGTTKTGETVTAFTLTNQNGASAVVLDYGCAIQSLCVPNAAGGFTDVVLGYDTLAEYEENDAFLGAAVGRFANRIGGASFALNGKTYPVAKNDGKNSLHGGTKGFDKYVWAASAEGETLVFRRTSPDGEEGYPGNLSLVIRYALSDENALSIRYEATTDADTILNLTNHSYFNLNGGGTALDHTLQIFAQEITENSSVCLPTGAFLPVEGTAFDFRTAKPLGRDIENDEVQLHNGHGYDHNFVLDNAGTGVRPIAVLVGKETGIQMTTLTCQPGVQLYSANFLTPRTGKNGTKMVQRDGVCLETQGFPNAPHIPHFPTCVLKAGERFESETVYQFSIV